MKPAILNSDLLLIDTEQRTRSVLGYRYARHGDGFGFCRVPVIRFIGIDAFQAARIAAARGHGAALCRIGILPLGFCAIPRCCTGGAGSWRWAGPRRSGRRSTPCFGSGAGIVAQRMG